MQVQKPKKQQTIYWGGKMSEAQEIYNLGLNESINYDRKNTIRQITRTPGGWIYIINSPHLTYGEYAIFVPYKEETTNDQT